MKPIRDLERRLESIVEGLAAKVFRGQLHPLELGTRLVREADLASFEGDTGPTIPNVYVFRVSARDLQADPPPALRTELAAILEEEAADRGWRLEGPVLVELEADERLPAGSIECHVEVRPGELQPWGVLREAQGPRRLELRHNRLRVGRSASMDAVLDDPEVSRAHAMIWRESGEVWIRDLESSNGTSVDRSPVREPVAIYQGSLVSFGPATFTYRTV